VSARRRRAHRRIVWRNRFHRASRRAWQAARSGFISAFFRTFHLPKPTRPIADPGRSIIQPLTYRGQPWQADQ
jgi:hypothetical protein